MNLPLLPVPTPYDSVLLDDPLLQTPEAKAVIQAVEQRAAMREWDRKLCERIANGG